MAEFSNLSFNECKKRKKAYLEPYLKVECGTRMTSGVEKPESDAAVDTAADKNSDSEWLLLRHGTAEIWVEFGIDRR